MLRMTPFMFVSMDETEEDDGYPRIDEYGVKQHVEPSLPFDLNLEKDDHGQDVLTEHDRRHELRGNDVVDVRVKRRECRLDVADDDEEGRNHQEMRLQEVKAAVKDADVAALDALLEHFRYVAMRHIELPLRPALALAPRLHERQRLLVVDDGIVRPRRLDPFCQGFHRKLHVFRQTCRAPAVALKDVRRNAHARTAEHSGKPDVRLCQMADMVDDPEGDGERAGDPGIVRILGIEIALDDAVALAKVVVHLHQEAWVYEIIRIEYDDGIVLLLHLEEAFEHPFHGEALALLRRMRPLTDDAAVAARDFRRVVAAVVGDDKDIVERLRIFQCLQILQKLADDGAFVMRGDDDGEGLFRRQDLVFLPAPHAAKADEEIVQREQ